MSRTHYRFRGAGLALCGADYRYDGHGGETTESPSYVTCPMCRADLADIGMVDDAPAVDLTTEHAAEVRAALSALFGPAIPVTDAMVAAVLVTEGSAS